MQRIVCGGDFFEPSKVIGVGKNFPDHVREMGGEALPFEPVIFLKPNSAVVSSPQEVRIAAALGILHHEVELCVMAGARGKALSLPEAERLIEGYGVAIDFTLRERQARAKAAGEPWALAKGFDASAVIGALVSVREVSDPASLTLSLSVNGMVRQHGRVRDMLFAPARIVQFVSQFMTIEAGDLFLCGTPAGVGEVQDGDEIAAAVSGLPPLRFRVRRG